MTKSTKTAARLLGKASGAKPRTTAQLAALAAARERQRALVQAGQAKAAGGRPRKTPPETAS